MIVQKLKVIFMSHRKKYCEKLIRSRIQHLFPLQITRDPNEFNDLLYLTVSSMTFNITTFYITNLCCVAIFLMLLKYTCVYTIYIYMCNFAQQFYLIKIFL